MRGTPLSPLALLLLGTALWPLAAPAQTSAMPEAPPVEAAVIALPPEAAPLPAVPSAPSAPLVDGLIVLPEALPEEAETAPSTGTTDVQPDLDIAESVPRDGPEAAATPEITADAGEGWLLPLQPLGTLPEGVEFGASLAEPGILRLTGEMVEQDFRLDLPQGIAPPDTLSLVLRSSINVLPEAAEGMLSVNGAEPLPFALDRLGDFGALTLDTPGLKPGANLLSLSLRQPHRIYCGPEASFAVWTELDLARSGAHLPPEALALTPAGFALALQGRIAAGLPLEVLAGEDEDPALLRHVSDALGQAAGGRVRVEIRSFYTTSATRGAVIAVIASDQNRITLRHGASGALILQIEHVPGADLPDLSTWLPDLASNIAGGPPLLVPGQTTPLSALGSGDIIGNTRYFRHRTSFRLPDDWMLLANQKARLDLQYGFARNLPEGGILLVKVNGQTIRLLPLDREGGKILDPLPVGFAANLLHGGRNTLDFEMMVPGDPADAMCPPRRADMLVVLGESSLTVPPSPAMQLPGVTTALIDLAPAGIRAAKADGASTDAGPALERAAATLAAALPPAGSTVQNPGPEVTLSLTDLSRLDLVPLELSGLSPRQIEEVLLPRVQPRITAPAASEPAAPAAPRFTLDEEAPPAAALPARPGILSRAGEWISGLLGPDGWISSQREEIRRASFIGTTDTLGQWLGGQTGAALLLRPDPEAPQDLWLILGPDARMETIADSLDQLRADHQGQGEAILIAADGSRRLWSPIRLPELGAAVAPREIRTVLGNYASWSPLVFTLATLILALLSAIPALFFLVFRRGGRR